MVFSLHVTLSELQHGLQIDDKGKTDRQVAR